jgi:hypothetical protein
MAPQEQEPTMAEMADDAVRVFKAGVTISMMLLADFREGEQPPTKDEILLEIKTKFWEMFNRISSEESAADRFAREYNCELCERLQVADYTYKDDEDAEELLNVWAYHEAKKQMEN